MVLTVPRALSRIHHITKFTLKRAAEQSRSKTDTAKRHQKIDNRGRCSGVVTQAHGQPDNPVSSRGREPRHAYRRAISRSATTGSARSTKI
ncbi:hypothetical protein DSH38_27215 [Escherichia coli]|nr:hypothetical protein [Escherichia coli]